MSLSWWHSINTTQHWLIDIVDGRKILKVEKSIRNTITVIPTFSGLKKETYPEVKITYESPLACSYEAQLSKIQQWVPPYTNIRVCTYTTVLDTQHRYTSIYINNFTNRYRKHTHTHTPLYHIHHCVRLLTLPHTLYLSFSLSLSISLWWLSLPSSLLYQHE